ncbi:LysR substrate-binding domain-containing protein [Pseudomonas turukhanskensis]|uniref:Transcriptional regulator GcvA n=1 Tax=Pseudomonas turukhanskensis TaxID=1806536 RepID=A0A9W6NE37_9PSED|nr:LysR substrate-binding domain-containing protein [Pseudomonas turukhanskensis]GLK87340.1 transcriptional regulator GcvA [Pseudomonas turukhanskensis]
MTRFPSLDALRTFVLAATYLNVSRTAEELCLTQSAVSRQLKQLEAQLDVQLFHRTNRGLALTDSGQQYLSQIQKPMQQIHRATAQLLPRARTLSLFVDGAFAHTWLVKRLPQFRAQYPDIELELKLGASMFTLTGSTLGSGADVQIIFGSPPWPGFTAQPLLRMEEFPVCSPALLNGDVALRTPADLLNHTLIHEGDRSTWRRWLASADALPYESARATTAHDSLTCLSMAVDGQGVAIGDPLTCADYLAAGVLVKPFDHQVLLSETFCLAVAEGQRSHPGVQVFCLWLQGLFTPLG